MPEPIELPWPVLEAMKKSDTFFSLLEEWDLPGRDFGPGNTKSLTPPGRQSPGQEALPSPTSAEPMFAQGLWSSFLRSNRGLGVGGLLTH